MRITRLIRLRNKFSEYNLKSNSSSSAFGSFAKCALGQLPIKTSKSFSIAPSTQVAEVNTNLSFISEPPQYAKFEPGATILTDHG